MLDYDNRDQEGGGPECVQDAEAIKREYFERMSEAALQAAARIMVYAHETGWGYSGLAEGTERYLVGGLQPGSCLTALLSGRFFQECGRMDNETTANLGGWIKAMNEWAPTVLYGTPERVQAWIDLNTQYRTGR